MKTYIKFQTDKQDVKAKMSDNLSILYGYKIQYYYD